MSDAAPRAIESAPFPERGDRVLLDGLPGGPWASVVDGRVDRTLALDPPRLGGRVVSLPLGRPFVVSYAQREVPCEVDAELVGAPDAGGAGNYAALLMGEGRRLQRRSAVRVPMSLLVRASIDDEQQEVTAGAVTENLSAGGALLRVALPIAAGARLQAGIECGGEIGSLDLPARVVRCDRVDAERYPYRVAIAFLDMARLDEDRLVRIVFEHQRRIRRREAGID